MQFENVVQCILNLYLSYKLQYNDEESGSSLELDLLIVSC